MLIFLDKLYKILHNKLGRREIEIQKQAGAELCQAQLPTGIWIYFDLDLLHYIDYQNLKQAEAEVVPRSSSVKI